MSINAVKQLEEKEEYELDEVAVPPNDMVAFNEQRS